MRNLIITLVLLLTAMTVSADPITREQARKKAEAFMKSQNNSRQLAPVTNSRKLAPGRKSAAASPTAEYYVFNKGTREGFVIVSGDDETEPILGYCDEGEFDYEQMPPNMKEWLDDYAQQIAAIQSGRGTVVTDAVPTHPKVDQLMKSKWSQGNPYNLTCPEYFTLGRSVTGCVATAMAQLLYYNREKSVSETTAAMPAYDTWTSHATYGRLHVEGIPEGSPIDWENMKDEYGSANEKQKKAVADLMHYCGVAVKMDYTNASSGAQSWDAYQAFGKYFGYGSSVKFYDYTSVTSDTEWDRIIYNEIAAGRPIYISGSNSGGGHAFCADGYDGDRKYHINWGWGGTSDGYYLLTQLTPGKQGIGGSDDGYTAYRQIIVGLEPENFGEKAMSFSDVTVKNLCLKNFDADGDGKVTYAEAAAVESLGTVFQGKAIKTFKELYYFTGVGALPDDAFSGCGQLTTLRLPKNIQTLGARVFKNCRSLTELEIPSHIKSIGAEAFSGCSSLATLSMPDELAVINDGTFAGTALTTVSLPITVAEIGQQAFANCSKLTRVDVKTFQPASLKIAANTFEGTNLQKATLQCMQGTKAYFSTADVWKDFGAIVEKRDRSGGKFAKLEAGQKYYLYHAGTGQYLTKGEAWGTQAIVGDSPMRFVLNHTSTMPEGTYYLTSEDTGKSGNLVFRTSGDSNVGSGVKAAFVDGTLTNNRSNAYWMINEVSDGIYTIQTPSNATGYVAGQYWGVQTDHKSNAATPTYGVYSDIDYETHPTGCQWRLVAYDEQQARVYEAAVTLSGLIDVAKTRYINTDAQQAVLDNLESSYDELRAAQRVLRKKLDLIDFANDDVKARCVSEFDIDSDNELSLVEATKVSDFKESFYSSFQGNTDLTSFDELQYFTKIPNIYGNMFKNCTNLESIILPNSIVNIYYYAFRNCQKLKSIRLPEYISLISQGVFYDCTSLQEVICMNPDPANITMGGDVFKNVPLATCTLYVPFGSKAKYEQAEVWKEFGKIVETRGRTQPTFSPVVADVEGYIYNLSTRKYVTLGEAYGTQSVVAQQGIPYQFKHDSGMGEHVYYLYSRQTGKDGKIIFRVSTDEKVGEGVKACFGDGTLSAKAYWKLASEGDNIFTLQIPETDATYVAGEYLGVQTSHNSNVASPTFGLYYDVKGEGTKWAFVAAADVEAAAQLDAEAEALAKMLQTAKENEVDVASEQAVYDNPESTADQLREARSSVREKLHFINFADAVVSTMCLDKWDSNQDGELSYEEAAAVTDIGETFKGVSKIKYFEELKYFTSLKEIPANAFDNASALQSVVLPASVSTIGESAFAKCINLKYLVILNDQVKIPMGYYGLNYNPTLFVPASQLEAYLADTEWTEKCAVVEYTGKPVVTVTATRRYGESSADVKMVVTGAPVIGTAAYECAAITDNYQGVGTYPIQVKQGDITTEGVTYQDGVLTIQPAPLSIAVRNATRNVGETNPTFRLRYMSFCNGESSDVFTVRPVVTCEATPESPAGEYPIIVSGAEAANYEISYVNGVLTVVDPTGIDRVESDKQQEPVYDLQGRRVSDPKRGVYLKGKRKVVIK